MATQERLSALRSDDSWRGAAIGGIVALGLVLYRFDATGGLGEPFEVIVSITPLLLGGLVAGVLHEGSPGVAGRRAALIVAGPAALWMVGQHVTYLASNSIEIWAGAIAVVLLGVLLAVFVPLAMLIGKIGGLVGDRFVVGSARKVRALVGR